MTTSQPGYEICGTLKKKKNRLWTRQGWETAVNWHDNEQQKHNGEQPQANTGGESRQAQTSPWWTKSSSDEKCFRWQLLVPTGCSNLLLQRAEHTFTWEPFFNLALWSRGRYRATATQGVRQSVVEVTVLNLHVEVRWICCWRLRWLRHQFTQAQEREISSLHSENWKMDSWKQGNWICF